MCAVEGHLYQILNIYKRHWSGLNAEASWTLEVWPRRRCETLTIYVATCSVIRRHRFQAAWLTVQANMSRKTWKKFRGYEPTPFWVKQNPLMLQCNVALAGDLAHRVTSSCGAFSGSCPSGHISAVNTQLITRKNDINGIALMSVIHTDDHGVW